MLRPGLTRFILAFAVILYHLSQNIFLGYFAVGCFFILSGYWIALMYEKKYSKMNNTLKVFYVSRLWRLLPVFYTFTALGLIVNYLTDSVFFRIFDNLDTLKKSEVVFSNILLLGYSTSSLKLLVPAWSLDIELQFYILFPLLIFIVRNNRNRLILIIALFFILALYLIFFNQIYLLKTSLTYLYLFFLGVLFYITKIHPGIKVEKWSLTLFFAVILVQYLIPSLTPYYRDGTSTYYTVLSLTLILLAIPTLINSVHTPTNEKDKFWGEMSFLIYLSHWVWIGPYNLLIADITKLERIPYIIGFLAITMLSSFLVYKWVDRPSEKLRQKWVNRHI